MNPARACEKKLLELRDKGVSEVELNKQMELFIQEYNAHMECVNKKLGVRIGVLINRAKTLCSLGNYKETRKVCRKILDVEPECDEAALIEAECLFHERKPKESLDCLRSILEKDSGNPQAHFQVSAILLMCGEPETALNAIDEAITLTGENFDHNIIKAQILYLIEDNSYQEWLEKAGKLDSGRLNAFKKHSWITKEEYKKKSKMH